MKKVNVMNKEREEKLNEKLACEKLNHISDILEYKFGIQNTPGINKKEYDIFIEDVDEEIYFQHTYSMEEMVECHVELQAFRLRKDFSICIALETFKTFEEEVNGN
ncbi:hypothetical protein [Clostridium estertheticum]|uniref:Uncharacterized protein n=1 Tax=Clostridium estertheticum TaxID=238834 RepID=A0A7Y3T2L3_9CLOT|nr:hypothetical protein [Clostridium estertheticum]NNU78154.1 hypothetical protein [Clostridium estertheticum]WBL47734.1 hypothetical protein LOR37_03325 [Clostridium estertheticum]